MRRILERTALAATTVVLSLLVILGQRHSTRTIPAFIQMGQSLAAPGDLASEDHSAVASLVFDRASEDGNTVLPALATEMPDALTDADALPRILNVRKIAGRGISRLVFDLDKPSLASFESRTPEDLLITFERANLTETAREGHILPDDIMRRASWSGKSGEKPAFRVKLASEAQYQVSNLKEPYRVVVDFASPRLADFLATDAYEFDDAISAQKSLADSLALKVRRVVIDPGHGGSDRGAAGPSGLSEKEVTLDIARRLKDALELQYGVEALLTRTDDSSVSLEKRAEFANQNGADLFISLHVNASESSAAADSAESRGVEAYSLSLSGTPEALLLAARENRLANHRVGELSSLVQKIALAEVGGNSQFLAKQLLNSVSAGISSIDPRTGHNRGTRTAPLLVLVGVKAPATLIELPFISNAQDEALLRNGSFCERIARSIAQGIARYASFANARRTD